MRRNDEGWFHHVDDLDHALRSNPDARVLLLSHPHNPTGRVMDSETMDAVVSTAVAHDVMNVSDEIHGDLIYRGFRHRSMLTAAGSSDRVVVSTSAAKTFAMSGLRSSVLVCGTEEVRQRLEAARPSMLLGHAGRPGSDATSAAWNHGAEWTDGLIVHLTAVRSKLIDRLGAEAPAVRFHPPDATFLAWLDLERCGLRSAPAERLLELARVAVEEGSVFGPERATTCG